MENESRFSNLEIDGLPAPRAPIAPTPAPVAPTPAPIIVAPVTPSLAVATPTRSEPVFLEPRVSASSLVAVQTADETTGAVVYWRLSGDVRIERLRAAWAAQGRKAETCAEPASPEVALRRAVQELEQRDVMIRKHPAGGWALVHERSTADEKLIYTVGARVYATEEGIAVEPGDGETQVDAERLAAIVRTLYDENRAKLTTQDISAWIVSLAHKLHAVALRGSGGIYFIPRDGVKAYRVVKAALSACSSHRLFEIPALKSSEALAAILDAISTEVSSTVTEIEAELSGDGFGARKARNRIEACDQLGVKIASYEKLLGRPLGDALARLSAVKAKLSQASSRAANLEI